MRTAAKRLPAGIPASCDWLLRAVKGGTNGCSRHSSGRSCQYAIAPDTKDFSPEIDIVAAVITLLFQHISFENRVTGPLTEKYHGLRQPNRRNMTG